MRSTPCRTLHTGQRLSSKNVRRRRPHGMHSDRWSHAPRQYVKIGSQHTTHRHSLTAGAAEEATAPLAEAGAAMYLGGERRELAGGGSQRLVGNGIAVNFA